jgi:hypothetical protein
MPQRLINDIFPAWKSTLLDAQNHSQTEECTKKFIADLLDYLGSNPTVEQYAHVANALDYLFQMIDEQDKQRQSGATATEPVKFTTPVNG